MFFTWNNPIVEFIYWILKKDKRSSEIWGNFQKLPKMCRKRGKKTL